MTTKLPSDLLHSSESLEVTTTSDAGSPAACVYVFSRQGVCRWSNVAEPSGAEVFGSSIRELLPDGSPTGDQVLRRVVETGRGAAFISFTEAHGTEAHGTEAHGTEAHGTPTGIKVRLSPIDDASGRVETVVASCGERAGLVRVEEGREVAHDFNNALAAILGHTQALMAQIKNEDHLRSLRHIDRAARDSAEIVKRVPDFANLDTGTTPAAEPLATVDGPGPVASEHGASVLVIDDDPLIRRTMADLLALDGHEATLAADGEEGISLFESGEYDVVFTDLALPGMSGWAVAAAIKAGKPHIPVVMVTGWGVTLEQKEIESAGVDAVVPKPFGVKTVLGLVRNLVASAHPPSETEAGRVERRYQEVSQDQGSP